MHEGVALFRTGNPEIDESMAEDPLLTQFPRTEETPFTGSASSCWNLGQACSDDGYRPTGTNDSGESRHRSWSVPIVVARGAGHPPHRPDQRVRLDLISTSGGGGACFSRSFLFSSFSAFT